MQQTLFILLITDYSVPHTEGNQQLTHMNSPALHQLNDARLGETVRWRLICVCTLCTHHCPLFMSYNEKKKQTLLGRNGLNDPAELLSPKG